MSRTPDTTPDCLYYSDNQYGIPLLDLGVQARELALPFLAWGSAPRRSRFNGCWHFYVDDAKFSTIWRTPTLVTNSRCVSLVEPNYSVNDQMPFAPALWAIYRKRWLARHWQGCGISVLVDLNVGERYEQVNLLGVPAGWGAYATRACDREIAVLEWHLLLAVKRAESTKLLFVVYGGGRKTQAFCREKGLLWFPDQGNAVREAKWAEALVEADGVEAVEAVERQLVV